MINDPLKILLMKREALSNIAYGSASRAFYSCFSWLRQQPSWGWGLKSIRCQKWNFIAAGLSCPRFPATENNIIPSQNIYFKHKQRITPYPYNLLHQTICYMLCPPDTTSLAGVCDTLLGVWVYNYLHVSIVDMMLDANCCGENGLELKTIHRFSQSRRRPLLRTKDTIQTLC